MWEIGIRPDAQQIRVWRKQNNNRVIVDTSTYAIQSGVDYHLRAEFTDVSIKLFINGELAHTMQHEAGTNRDLTYLSDATKFGLSSFDDHTTFDDFAVYDLNTPSFQTPIPLAYDDFDGRTGDLSTTGNNLTSGAAAVAPGQLAFTYDRAGRLTAVDDAFADYAYQVRRPQSGHPKHRRYHRACRYRRP
jgi:hypothetical protein